MQILQINQRTYPPEATNVWWQAHKGKLDKIGKTGLGPLLVEAENKWKAIDIRHLEPPDPKTIAEAEQNKAKAEAALKKYPDAIKATDAAIKKAQDVAHNKLMTPTSLTALERVRTGLTHVGMALNQVHGAEAAIIKQFNEALVKAKAAAAK